MDITFVGNVSNIKVIKKKYFKVYEICFECFCKRVYVGQSEALFHIKFRQFCWARSVRCRPA